MPRPAPMDERFFAKVHTSGVCWQWTAAKNNRGYGVFNRGQGAGTVLAHRWAYEFLVGPIPVDRQLDHLCRNRSCVNPDHLEPVTGRTNTLRGSHPAAQNARKERCSNCGGAYSDQIVRGQKVGRYCKPCNSAWQLAKYYRNKGARP
jgi:hypothetical protein